MKKLILLFLVLVLKFAPAKAQWVTIPDYLFRLKLTQLFPTCMNGNQMDTTCAGIVNATTLNLQNSAISNLEGIQYFQNLLILNCSNNANLVIPSLPPALEKLICNSIITISSGNNPMTSLPPLPINLKYIDCSYNYITNLPNLPPSLDTLICGSNPLSSLPTLPNSLKMLDCSYAPLYNLANFLPPSLLDLNCAVNYLTTLPFLPNGLKKLNCYNNEISNLPTLPNTLINLNLSTNPLTCPSILPPNLEILNIAYTNLGNSNFPTLPATLLTLDCSSYGLTILPPLPPILESLNCTDCGISTLPILPNTLKYLSCQYCINLSTLPQLSDSLQYLYCSYTDLVVLPDLPNNLKTLSLTYSEINSIPEMPNTLEYLDCTYNLITDLPNLSNSLKTLNCSFNQLAELPALPNSIQTLNCNNNQLTFLPFLQSSLLSIKCNNNFFVNLPELPPFLRLLYCDTNQIVFLPSIPISLINLKCNNNNLTSLPELPNFMNELNISNNSVACLTNLPTSISSLNISNNLLSCVPIQSIFTLGLPLCIENDPNSNPNNCPAVNITGIVYTDQNNNCSYNAIDLNTNNVPVKLYNSQNNLIAQSTTINGRYSFANLQPGNYQVKIATNSLPVGMSCGQSSTRNVTLNSSNQTLTNIYFPVICDEGYDLNIQSINTDGWVFPGQIHNLTTNIVNNENWNNLNCDSVNTSGSVSIVVSGPVSFVAPAAGALTPTVSGDTFTYTISDFNYLNPNSLGLRLITDTTAQATDQICVHVEISPNPMDSDTTNNVYDFCYDVVNSYDPNMKEVYPTNVLPGYDDWFTYTIHFQNTGNAPAFNIRLRDTLDTQLDLNTFEVLGYSHPATVGLSGNILTVRFNNILLPDSTSDYEGSMGYFQYRIKPNGAILNGSQISNTAYIYFDYNAPIITNTTENNFICSPVTSSLSYTICLGDSVQVGNDWYSSAANFSNSFVSPLGCDSIVNVSITQTILDTSLFASGDTIYANENYMNYEWINCANDSTLQNSASNNFIIPFTGNFKVKITNNDGCNVVSNCIPLSIICLPISSQQSFTICIGDSVQVGNSWYSSAGNYTNSFVTPVGCDSIVNTIITETSIDTSVVLTGNTLNAVSGYVNYSWIDCSTGLEIDGENSNELVAPYAGFFKSVITSTDGCVSESSCIAVILTGNETTLNSNTQTFEIYPNPSSGIFTFKDTKNIQRVEVYDVLGQEIAVFVGDNTNKVSKQINLSGYSKGVYFAKINGSIVLKMVKE